MKRFCWILTVGVTLSAFLLGGWPGQADAAPIAPIKLKMPSWAEAKAEAGTKAKAKARHCPEGQDCRPRWEAVLYGGGSYGAPHVFQGVYANVRLRYLHRIPFALEFGGLFPEGVTIAVLTDAWRGRNWRLHLPDFGILYLIGEPKGFIRPDVKRRFDIILGMGGELQIHRGVWLTADLRFFMPDPTSVPLKYGGFCLPIYEDAAKGIQIWVGLGKRFW